MPQKTPLKQDGCAVNAEEERAKHELFMLVAVNGARSILEYLVLDR